MAPGVRLYGHPIASSNDSSSPVQSTPSHAPDFARFRTPAKCALLASTANQQPTTNDTNMHTTRPNNAVAMVYLKLYEVILELVAVRVAYADTSPVVGLVAAPADPLSQHQLPIGLPNQSLPKCAFVVAVARVPARVPPSPIAASGDPVVLSVAAPTVMPC